MNDIHRTLTLDNELPAILCATENPESQAAGIVDQRELPGFRPHVLRLGVSDLGL